MKQTVINLFVNNTNYSKNDIISVQEIHCGFTNLSFKFCVREKQPQLSSYYQVRLSCDNKIVNRSNEYNVLQLIKDKNYIYYDKNGNAIKKWIDGVNPNLFWLNKKSFLFNLVNEITKFHSYSLKQDNIMKHDYFMFLDKTNFFNPIDQELFLELISKYKNLKTVLSHNDLNPKNMIYKKDKSISLIDFEWTRVNNQYWDIANFYRETNLSYKWLVYMTKLYKNLDMNIMKDFVYISTNYAYQWTFGMSETKKILKYRKKLIKKLNRFRKWVSIYEKQNPTAINRST